MTATQKPEASLSQWDALMLESLKAHGWSNDELINRVNTGDFPADESKFRFDYSALTAYAKENADSFKQAVQQGYHIKYNTIRGIHSWIFVALKQDAELLLDPGHEAVIASLSDAEARQLAAVLSFGWQVIPQDGTRNADSEASSYRIEPIQR
ncbi:hypothetical protein [Paenibacillus sinopodophylli]|uniref:hypothetical protein n=1 Tax=Paenibacillus sinopodophylli TaxID=1837342 RepID=UPI00110CC0C1|nr:hypothetical protein [Paenibacillus sinopodophylli]